MVLNTRSLAAIVALGSALVACGGEPAPAGSAALVATTGIWADVASRVACRDGGDPAVVPALIPDGADPHTFEPSLRDRRTLEHAMVVIANGAGLEGATADLLGAARRSGTRVVELADVVGTIDGDPHVWQDPTVVAAALDAIADAAVATGGPHPQLPSPVLSEKKPVPELRAANRCPVELPAYPAQSLAQDPLAPKFSRCRNLPRAGSLPVTS